MTLTVTLINIVIFIVKRQDTVFVIRKDEGVVKEKRLNNNARIPVRSAQRRQVMTWLQLNLQYVRHMLKCW